MPEKDLITTIFLKADFWIHRILNSIGAFHHGFWLGVFNGKRLHMLSDLTFSSEDLYSQTSYNLSGLFEWEKSAFDQFFSGCNSILIGAAGGGREAIALLRLGIQVTAFECCKKLAELCKELLIQQSFDAPIVHSLPDQVPQGLGTFDGFIMGWGAYMHIPGSTQRIRFLSSVRKHLNPESPILLSFFARKNDSLRLKWVKRIANVLRSVLPGREPAELGDTFHSTFYVHYFTKNEICDELNKSGFDLLFFSETPYPHAVATVMKSSENK